MERFIDSLSKQLAKTTSRRSMLSITSRILFGTFVTSTGIGRLWAQTPGSPGGPGSSACGAVQKVVQLAFPDSIKYSNHGQFVSSVAHSVGAAENANLITGTCSDCIVSQFAQSISVSDQQPCGVIVPPAQSCTQTGITPSQVQTAAILSLGAAP